MVPTITKEDMRRFMGIMFPKGYRMSHTFDIYTDLKEKERWKEIENVIGT
jgi:hypothetical protein